MIGTLKKLGGMRADTRAKGYRLMRYWHPDSGSRVTHATDLGKDGWVATLEEAQAICSAPESSYQEGDTSTWWYVGYSENGSRTAHLTLWKAIAGE